MKFDDFSFWDFTECWFIQSLLRIKKRTAAASNMFILQLVRRFHV